jgi:hypothetical protein
MVLGVEFWSCICALPMVPERLTLPQAWKVSKLPLRRDCCTLAASGAGFEQLDSLLAHYE